MLREYRAPVRGRRLVESACLVLILLLLFRTVGAEPYGVPTGSMAPTLLGQHIDAACPRCGMPLRVGVQQDSGLHAGEWTLAICTNCGLDGIALQDRPVTRGDLVLVNRGVFDFRKPRRWEMAVFHCPADRGKSYVKRVVGLPGESVEIRDGDIYIDNKLARKTLHECKATRIPIVDMDVGTDDWQSCWEITPPSAGAAVYCNRIELDAANGEKPFVWAAYRHQRAKDRPITDEYVYNGLDSGRLAQPVHDFFLECDVELSGANSASSCVAFTVTDGGDDLMMTLPANGTPGRLDHVRGEPPTALDGEPLRHVAAVDLSPRHPHHVELCFTDRRLSFAVDGSERCVHDLESRPARQPVVRPFRIGVRGGVLQVKHVRLYRDIYYTEAGRHGIGLPVPLGPGEYFVLGDNSPHSDDSRFWTDAAGNYWPVREQDFVGKPFLVHLPSRFTTAEAFGRRWQFQTVDWQRIRWLH